MTFISCLWSDFYHYRHANRFYLLTYLKAGGQCLSNVCNSCRYATGFLWVPLRRIIRTTDVSCRPLNILDQSPPRRLQVQDDAPRLQQMENISRGRTTPPARLSAIFARRCHCFRVYGAKLYGRRSWYRSGTHGLRGGNASWLICWFRRYTNCLFVCLLNFLSYLFTSLLIYFLCSRRREGWSGWWYAE